MVLIRCWNFDQDTGEPISPYGCFVKNCGYAHPNDPAWKNAIISRRPGRRPERSPAASTSSRVSGEMGNISKRQPSVQKDGTRIPQSWSLGENLSAPTGWGNPGDSEKNSWISQDQQATPRGWDAPNLSSTSAQAPPFKSLPPSSLPFRPPPPLSSHPPLPPPHTETFRRRSSPPRAPRNHSTSSDDYKVIASARKDGNKVITSARNISKSSSAQEEIGFRINIIAKAVRLRLKLIDYQEVKTNWNRLPKSARYLRLGEAGQNILAQRRDERDSIIKSSKEELEKIVTELREMEVWPTTMLERHSSRGNGVIPAAFADIQQRLQMLENKFQVFQKEYLKPKVDYRDVCVSTMDDSDSQASEPERRDLFSRLEDLEERIDEIGNTAVIEVLQAKESLEQKMEGLQLDLQIDEDAVVDGAKPTALREKLAWFSNEYQLIATKLSECTVGHTKISQLEEDNAKLKAQLEKVQEDNQSLKASIDDNARELQALSEAIKVLQLQASHRNNPLDERIIELMRHRITQDVINSLKPSLDDLVAQLDSRMKTSQDETLNRIISDFGPAVDFINALYDNFAKVQQSMKQ